MRSQAQRVQQFLSAVHGSGPALVMAIINLTPDSFNADSRLVPGHLDAEMVRRRVAAIEAEGASVIDLGAESTRPGSDYVSVAVELDRLLPALRLIRECTNLPISVDTRKAQVAQAALDAGADIINDISAGLDDPAMAPLVAKAACPFIIMHRQGEPKTMQINPQYEDVVAEVHDFLIGRTEALMAAGIGQRAMIIDPGLGFGKTFAHNWELVAQAARLTNSGFPVLVGHSHKGFVGHLLGRSGEPRPLDGRLAGTVALTTILARSGVRVVRVHDVQPNVDAVRVVEALGSRAVA